MKSARNILFALLFLAAGLSPLAAQQAGARIDKIRLSTEKTPVYNAARHSSQNNWLAVNVDYATKTQGGWLSDVEVRVVLLIETDSGRVAMDRTVAYRDVKDGNHHAVVYVKPAFFDRYMKSHRPESNRISVYAEILANKQRIAREEKKGNAKVPDGWFRSLNSVRDMSGELRAKSATPFAPLDYDYYEDEATETGKGN